MGTINNPKIIRVPPCASAVKLDAEWVRREVRRFLDEDIGSGDITTDRVIPPTVTARAKIVARERAVMAGIELAQTVFQELDTKVRFDQVAQDGEEIKAGATIANLSGRAAPILTGERLALNLLQRLSGIATLTRRYVDAVAGTGAHIFDTRKTTPGLRPFEKCAVRAGGGRNHRAGLYDAILIKDNHLAIAGGVAAAIRRARLASEGSLWVQIEVESLDQLREALDEGVDAVLLDNMPPGLIGRAVELVRQHIDGAKCWIEASGGITLENVREYADAGVDAISIGALTHSGRAVDFALEILA